MNWMNVGIGLKGLMGCLFVLGGLRMSALPSRAQAASWDLEKGVGGEGGDGPAMKKVLRSPPGLIPHTV